MLIPSCKNKEAEFQSSGCPTAIPPPGTQEDRGRLLRVYVCTYISAFIRSAVITSNPPDVRPHINNLTI